MYINYFKERFDSHGDTCSVVLDDTGVIDGCEKKSKEAYAILRQKYIDKLLIHLGDDTKYECVIDKLKENLDKTHEKIIEYEDESGKISKEMHTNISKLESNKALYEEIQDDILMTEQRLTESESLDYINKVKLYVYIGVIVVILIIQLVLIFL
jgi:hypothetical protein